MNRKQPERTCPASYDAAGEWARNRNQQQHKKPQKQRWLGGDLYGKRGGGLGSSSALRWPSHRPPHAAWRQTGWGVLEVLRDLEHFLNEKPIVQRDKFVCAKHHVVLQNQQN